MTIEELINELGNIAEVVGYDATVRVWNIFDPMAQLEVRGIKGTSQGFDVKTSRQCATIRIDHT